MTVLKDKVCIVTGAAGSLGRAVAARFVEEGARVMMVDRDIAPLADAVRTLDASPGQVATVAADVADSAATRAYVDATIAAFGSVDVLFSNAGISGPILPVTDYPEDVFDRVMAVNVKGSFLACKHVLPVMRNGGSIVMTTSVVGVTSDPGISGYASSKHALIGLMRTVAKEAAPRGIRVNAIAPGPIANDFQREVERGLTGVLGRDGGEFLDQVIPMHRHGRATEIAEAVLFLASDRSSFTTGAVLMADGGMHV
ncbi:MAG: SDR family NAD(P)-dependent oxidoreductase [Pseudomonadota bacterium]